MRSCLGIGQNHLSRHLRLLVQGSKASILISTHVNCLEWTPCATPPFRGVRSPGTSQQLLPPCPEACSQPSPRTDLRRFQPQSLRQASVRAAGHQVTRYEALRMRQAHRLRGSAPGTIHLRRYAWALSRASLPQKGGNAVLRRHKTVGLAVHLNRDGIQSHQ